MGGGVYALADVVSDIFIDHIELKTALFTKFHEIITSSPGGGLWYIYALFWIMIILYFYDIQNRASFLILLIISVFLYLLRPVMNLTAYQDTFLGVLKRSYDFIFLSEQTFFFHMIFFLSGMTYFYFKTFFIKQMNLEVDIGWLVLGYFTYIYTSNYENSLIGSIILQILRLNLSIAYFNLAIYINKYIESNEKIGERVKKLGMMSSVIYFSHFSLIYCIRVMCMLFGTDYQSKLTFFCILLWGILSIYSFLIVKHRKIKFVKVFYPL